MKKNYIADKITSIRVKKNVYNGFYSHIDKNRKVVMKTNIRGCARCGQDHMELEMKKLTNPITVSDTIEFGYWVMCPKLDEPILIQVFKETT